MDKSGPTGNQLAEMDAHGHLSQEASAPEGSTRHLQQRSADVVMLGIEGWGSRFQEMGGRSLPNYTNAFPDVGFS